MHGYRTRLAIDLPIIALGLAGASMALVEVPPPPCLPGCVPPAAMNALDRLAVGGYAAGALTAANVALAALVLAPLGLELVHARGRRMWRGMLVYGQALVLTVGVTQALKFAVGRLAPFVYTPAEAPASALLGPDAARSFPSGHTSTAFVAAAVLVVGCWLHRPGHRARWPLLVAALIAAACVGALKVVAGYHYWTDVIAGALIGTAIAVLVTTLHRQPSELSSE